MAKKLPSDIVELSGRAETDAKPKDISMQQAARPAAQTHRRSESPQRRDVYGGNIKPKKQTYEREYIVPQANKKVSTPKKRRSTFNIVAALFLSAVAIILYIGNILTVNQLAVEVHQLQTQYDKIVNSNNVLKAEINRKSAWERIGNTATQQVGLVYAKEHPASFDVDESKLEKFKEK